MQVQLELLVCEETPDRVDVAERLDTLEPPGLLAQQGLGERLDRPAQQDRRGQPEPLEQLESLDRQAQLDSLDQQESLVQLDLQEPVVSQDRRGELDRRE